MRKSWSDIDKLFLQAEQLELERLAVYQNWGACKFAEGHQARDEDDVVNAFQNAELRFRQALAVEGSGSAQQYALADTLMHLVPFGDDAIAVAYLDEALKLMQAARTAESDPSIRRRLLYAQALIARGSLEEGDDAYTQQALEIIEAVGLEEPKNERNLNLWIDALRQRAAGSMDPQARELLSQAIRLNAELKSLVNTDERPQLEYDEIILQARIAMVSDYESSAAALKDAAQQMRRMLDTSLPKSRVNNALGQIFAWRARSQPGAAVPLFTQALSYFEQANADNKRSPSILLNASSVALAIAWLSKPGKAAEYCRMALRFAEKSLAFSRDQRDGKASVALAKIYLSQYVERDESIQLLLASRDTFVHLRNVRSNIIDLINLTSCLFRLSQLQNDDVVLVEAVLLGKNIISPLINSAPFVFWSSTMAMMKATKKNLIASRDEVRNRLLSIEGARAGASAFLLASFYAEGGDIESSRYWMKKVTEETNIPDIKTYEDDEIFECLRAGPLAEAADAVVRATRRKSYFSLDERENRLLKISA